MFGSKIWFFLITVGAFVALAIALILPKPAERKAVADEERRLADACAVTNILLTDNARVRINLAGDFSRFASVAGVLDQASREKTISGEVNKSARDAADELLGSVTGSIKPAFVLMLDARGRVVARAGDAARKSKFGDSMAGYFLVDDALHGYLRDDLWLYENSLYRVAAAPVVRREVGVRDRYAGAVVLGHPVDTSLAEGLREQVRFDVSFYAGGSVKASSTPVELHKDVLEAHGAIAAGDRPRTTDCAENKPFYVTAGNDDYAVVIARLPGEAAGSGAFYAVYSKRPKAVGFLGTLDAVDGNDLGFGNFPWLLLGLALVFALGLGMFLMIWEADLPLKRLAADAVLLAKGEKDRLAEDQHRGKYGSIARSVNIQLDKQEREAKAAKKDLDQLLGPAPEDSLAGAPSPLPLTGPGGFGMGDNAFEPPPPSEFVFKDAAPPPPPPSFGSGGGGGGGGGGFDLDLPPPPGREPPPPPPQNQPTKIGPNLAPPINTQVPPAPVSMPGEAKAPPPIPRRAPSPPPLESIDADILGDDDIPETPAPTRPPSDFDAPTRVADPSRSLLEAAAAGTNGEAAAFRQVYDDFLALKEKCGESTKNLTFEKFATKLKKNRQALIDKHGCKEVKFQVYVKDGRAALKATPVKS